MELKEFKITVLPLRAKLLNYARKLLMHEIIDSLPNLQRTIMRMKDIEGYETDEIAEITGCGPEAIRSNLSRARKKVRDVYLRTIQERKERRNEP